MSGIIVPNFEMPECCAGCPFRSPYEDHCVDAKEGTYQRISRCCFQPEEVEDGYEASSWLLHNKYSWCPLKPYDEEASSANIELSKDELALLIGALKMLYKSLDVVEELPDYYGPDYKTNFYLLTGKIRKAFSCDFNLWE